MQGLGRGRHCKPRCFSPREQPRQLQVALFASSQLLDLPLSFSALYQHCTNGAVHPSDQMNELNVQLVNVPLVTAAFKLLDAELELLHRASVAPAEVEIHNSNDLLETKQVEHQALYMGSSFLHVSSTLPSAIFCCYTVPREAKCGLIGRESRKAVKMVGEGRKVGIMLSLF